MMEQVTVFIKALLVALASILPDGIDKRADVTDDYRKYCALARISPRLAHWVFVPSIEHQIMRALSKERSY